MFSGNGEWNGWCDKYGNKMIKRKCFFFPLKGHVNGILSNMTNNFIEPT